jgi:hypothetical protein
MVLWNCVDTEMERATYSGARASELLEPIIAKIIVARAMTCCPTDSMSLEVGTAVGWSM